MPATPDKRYFKLFTCCLPVKGAARSVICDVQRTDLQPIPNDLYDILIHYKNKSVDEIKADYHEDTYEDIDEYFSFLEENEYGFWCNNPEQFPDIDLHWESPYMIANAIIDSNESSNHNYKNIIDQLSHLGCAALQLRFYNSIDLEKLDHIIKYTNGSRLRSVEIIVKYAAEMSEDATESFLNQNPIISSFTVHSAPFDKKTTTKANIAKQYTTQLIDNSTHCGIISASYFFANLDNFTEAQKWNTCLNMKLSVDVDGSIKNCPSLPQTFGHAATTSFQEIIQSEEFRKMWHVQKDQIEICKDCEFRYICTDCRAFTQNDDLYTKPAKCKYDPYTAEWGN